MCETALDLLYAPFIGLIGGIMQSELLMSAKSLYKVPLPLTIPMAKKKKEPEMKLTKYEKARIIGARALQLSMGAPFMLKISKKDLEEMHYNTVEIAKREFKAGVIPIGVRRVLSTVMEDAEQ